MREPAQSHLQLYRQMHEAGYAPADFAPVRDAYEVGMELFSACYDSSLKPFVVHGIGTASVLASIRQPAAVVAAGILHNVYWNGNFGDGTRGISRRKQEELRRRLGIDVEQYLERFGSLKWTEQTLPGIVNDFDRLDDVTRTTIVIRLADHVDHFYDEAMALSPNAANRQKLEARKMPFLVELSEKVGFPELGEEMRLGLERSLAVDLPDLLRRESDWHFSFRITPRSDRTKLICALRERLWHGFGIRKRLRRMLGKTNGRS